MKTDGVRIGKTDFGLVVVPSADCGWNILQPLLYPLRVQAWGDELEVGVFGLPLIQEQ